MFLRCVRLGVTAQLLGAALVGTAVWPELATRADAAGCYQRGAVQYIVTNQTTNDGRSRTIAVTETDATLNMLGYDGKPLLLRVTWTRPAELVCDTTPVDLTMRLDGSGSFVGRIAIETGAAPAALSKYASTNPTRVLNAVRLPDDLARYLSDPTQPGYAPLPPGILVGPGANGPAYASSVTYKLDLASRAVGAEFRVRVELGGLDALGANVFWPYSSAASTSPPVAPADTASSSPDGAALFQQLMPVLSSPRCANCHGQLDVFADNTPHKGGVQQPGDSPWTQCQTCHSRLGTGDGPAIWRQPASDDPAHWGGLSANAICRGLLADPAGVIDHLQNDPRVALGFDGLRDIGEDSPYWPIDAAPPPIDRDTFIALAQDWLDATTDSKACPE